MEKAFELILHRPPDPEALEFYCRQLRQGRLTPAGLFETLQQSEEYRQRRCPDPRHDPALRHSITADFPALSEALARGATLSRQAYEQCWAAIFRSGRKLVIGQAQYGIDHKRRFFELMDAVALLLGNRPGARLLEFGVSEFSGMYRRLFPAIELHLADRPVPAGHAGFTPDRARRISGARHYYPIDLERPEMLADLAARRAGHYDLILFTEVLEHLVVHPCDLLEPLLRLLAPGGHLYLTTPNFFCAENLARIAARENPQPLYPRRGGNWDAHHHHREYGHKELFRLIESAGGQVAGFHFSACWDDVPPACEAERRNLVFVVRAAPSLAAGKAPQQRHEDDLQVESQ